MLWDILKRNFFDSFWVIVIAAFWALVIAIGGAILVTMLSGFVFLFKFLLSCHFVMWLAALISGLIFIVASIVVLSLYEYVKEKIKDKINN